MSWWTRKRDDYGYTDIKDTIGRKREKQREGEFFELESFLGDVNDIKNDVNMMRHNVEILNTKYDSVVQATESDAKIHITNELKRLRNVITHQSSKLRDKIKLAHYNNEVFISKNRDCISSRSSEKSIRENEVRCLVSEFLQEVQHYQHVLSTNELKMKQRAYRELQIVLGPDSDPSSDYDLDVLNPQELYSHHVFEDTSAKNDDRQRLLAYDYLNQRKADIADVEEAIRELWALFEDTKMLVSQQAEILDCIEQNVKHSLEYTVAANKVLVQTAEVKTSTRKKRVMIVVVICATIGFVLVTVISVAVLLFIFLKFVK